MNKTTHAYLLAERRARYVEVDAHVGVWLRHVLDAGDVEGHAVAVDGQQQGLLL